MTDDIAQTIASVVDRFNRHAATHPKVAEELAGRQRTIAVRLTDGSSYAVDLHDGKLENLRSPSPPTVDVSLRTDVATFRELVNKEIGPMKAIVTGRLKLEGSLEDKLLFRKLL